MSLSSAWGNYANKEEGIAVAEAYVRRKRPNLLYHTQDHISPARF